jgi:hypothetical protein
MGPTSEKGIVTRDILEINAKRGQIDQDYGNLMSQSRPLDFPVKWLEFDEGENDHPFRLACCKQ